MLPNYSMSIGNMLKMSLHQIKEKNIHELQLLIYLTILKKVGRLIKNSKEEPDIVLLWEHNVVSLQFSWMIWERIISGVLINH